MLSERVLRFSVLGLGSGFVLGLGRGRIGEEMGDVFFTQFFSPAERKFTHGEGAHANANEFGDAETEGLQHETDLAFEAGLENHGETAGRDAFAVFSARLADFGNVDAFDQLKENLGLVVLVDGDLVFLFELLGRMGQLLGEIAVIGENEEAFRVEVKAADMLEMMILVR